MRNGLIRLGGVLAVGAAPAAALAAPWEFSGEVEGRAGYATNPFLRPGEDRGAPSVGGRISGVVTRREATSVTSFLGGYTRDQYLSGGYSASDSLHLEASRNQTFSERLSGNAKVYYDNSRNAFTDPIDTVDIITAGNRRRTIGGEAGLAATLSARDTAGFTVFANRSTYQSRAFGNFTQYGGTGYYSHVFTANTTAGVSLTVSRTDTARFGDTTTYQPNLTLTQRFSPVWVFDGSVGVIFQDTNFGGFSDKSTSLGFSGNLCGTYPRSSLCFRAARQTSASGFGGLRTETSGSVRYTYRIDERSRFDAGVSGGRSNAAVSDTVAFGGLNQTYFAADLGYERDLSQRFTIGVHGDYRLRKFRGTETAHGLSGLVTLTAKFGRVR